MNRIVFSRKQIEQLTAIANQFDNVTTFTVDSESNSGIGPTISVKIDLFENLDTKIDITDVGNW
jgi:hypothetical protein